MSSSLANNEFLVSNVCIIQYQCVRNCLSCPFQPMQVSACTKCAPFFSLSSSCLTCALGFFRQHGTGSVPNTDSCVRCYSNCQSCNSPSMFSCLSCYNNFQLANAKFQNACINCLFLANWPNNSGKTCDTECKMVDALGTIRNNPNCVSCLSGDSSQLLYSPACIACWSANKLAEGRCAPMPESQYILFLTDISNGLTNTAQWTSVNKLSSFTCQSNSLYGL